MKATFINLAASGSGDRHSHLCKDIFEGLSFMEHKSTFSTHWWEIGTNIPCLQAVHFLLRVRTEPNARVEQPLGRIKSMNISQCSTTSVMCNRG